MVAELIERAAHGLRFATFAAAIGALVACSQEQMEIYDASRSGGDYAVLNCDELQTAQLSIGQRLSGAARYSVAGEPTPLLDAQRSQIADVRTARNCPGGAAPEPVRPAEVVAEAPAGQPLAEPAFLQVATFLVEINRDMTVQELRAQGFPVQVRPITLAGDAYYRVILGPLATTKDVARADAAAIGLGFNDTFFVDG